MPQTSDGFVPDDGFQADQQQGKPEKSLKGFGENVLSSGGKFLSDLGTGVSNLVGAGVNAAFHPVDTAKEIAQSHPLDAIAAMGRYYKERYSHPLETAYQDPVGVLSDLSTVAGGIGAAGKLGALGKIPMAGRVGQAAMAVSDATNPLNLVTRVPMAMVPKRATDALGSKLYQSSLKVPPAVDRTKRMPLIETGLRNRIPVSKAGLEKTQGLINDIEGQVSNAVTDASNQGLTVPAQAVADRIDEVRPRFQTVNPVSDQQTLSASQHEFLANHPSQIPIDQAQDIKRNTYRKLKESAYGEQGVAQTEAQKALARGLKEEIYKQIPGIQHLGPQEKVLIDLEHALERFANREGNKQILGLEAPVAMAGAHAVAGGMAPAAATGLLVQFFDRFPALKSRVAIALANRGLPSGPFLSGMNDVKRLGPPAAQYGATQNPQQ